MDNVRQFMTKMGLAIMDMTTKEKVTVELTADDMEGFLRILMMLTCPPDSDIVITGAGIENIPENWRK